MRCRSCQIILLLCVAPLFAQTDSIQSQHQRDDEVWATKSGLPIADVRAIRISAGIGDTTPNSRLDSIDASSFKQRNHILVVERIGCIRLHMVERGSNGFTEIWSLNDVPGVRRAIGAPVDRPGHGICSTGGRINVEVTSDGRIEIKVPVLLDPFERTAPAYTYTVAWNGSRYELTDEH